MFVFLVILIKIKPACSMYEKTISKTKIILVKTLHVIIVRKIQKIT